MKEGYFKCEKRHCIMPVRTCVLRQGWNSYVGDIPHDPLCASGECDQGKTILKEWKKGKEMLTCSICGGNKLETDFYRNAATKTGHDTACKECRKAARKERNQAQERAAKQEKEEIMKPENNEDKPFVVVDFEDNPVLLERIKERAHEQFRPVEMQIMFELNQAMDKEAA